VDLPIAPLVKSVAGRTGDVMLSAADVSGLPTATYGSVHKTADTAVGSSAYVDVPDLSLTLPAAGTYLLLATIRGYVLGATAYLTTRLYNGTDAAAVPNSETLIYGTTDAGHQGTAPMLAVVTVSASKTITVQAKDSAGTNGIAGDSGGYSLFAYVRLA
jgi:hypothetical protein